MENHNKLKELNSTFEKINNEAIVAEYDVIYPYKIDNLTRKEIVVNFLKIFLTSIVCVAFCTFLIKQYIHVPPSENFFSFSIIILSFVGYTSFSLIPLAAIKRSNIEITNLLYTKSFDDNCFNLFFEKIINGITFAILSAVFGVLLFLIETEHFTTPFLTHFFFYLYLSIPFIMNGIFLFCSIYHYLKTKDIKEQKRNEAERLEHNQKIEENVNKLDQQLDTISKEILEYAENNLFTIHDIEYLEVFAKENELKNILKCFNEIENGLAKRNGFNSLSEMKLQDIKNKESNLQHILND